MDTATRRVAFRTAKVIQRPLDGQPGTSFVFEVNGVRIFCGGSNWIPADSFLTEIKADRYRAWIELMVSVADEDCGFILTSRSKEIRICSVYGAGASTSLKSCTGELRELHAMLIIAFVTSGAFSSGRTSCLAAVFTRLTRPSTTASA